MASANLFLDKSRSRDKGHPVCIRVCHLRKQWLITLNLSATVKDYAKALAGTSLTDNQKRLRDQMNECRTKAQAVLDNLTVITKDTFNRAYFSEVDITKAGSMVDLRTQYDLYIKELEESSQTKTAKLYISSRNSLMDFRGDVSMQHVDRDYLKRYETWMTKRGVSRSTVSIYLRSLRSIFNRAIKMKALHSKHYPFNDYTITVSEKSKNALYPDDIKKLYEYEPANDNQRRVLDYFFFSYLCSGMNMADVCSLRWKDIQGDRIAFERQKTVRTKRVVKTSVVYMSDEALEILKRRCNRNRAGENYVFPIYDQRMDADARYRSLIYFQRGANRMLQRIGGRLGFTFPLTMNIARHSFGTCLKMMNYDVALISDMLQHSNISTTQHYLKSIPDIKRREISNSLLDFKTLRAV